ncbi:MAG: BppU family phage baseplate upper protein, partial [Clostridium sp.]|nr:BppU family phage baseplate upper protein [Clostridium sp.]
MTSKKVSLNVWRSAHAVVTAVQGEIAARWIEVSLYDHDKRLDISEKTAAIYMTKPDKTIVYNTCEILDAKNGLISVELTSQMSAVAGTICDCEIHIMNNKGSLLKILGLTIIIDRSVEDDKAIESSNEFTLLLKALQEANGLIDSVTETLNEKLNEFDAAFDELSQQMQSQMNDWLAVKDEEILHKMQSVDDWLGNGDEQLQQVVTEAQIAVQAAVSQANTAADRANQAVEQMEQVAGELVDGAISEQKNQPNGIAGLDSSGKLIQMPTANDIGAVLVGTTINGKALSGNITLTAQDVSAIASSARNQANGVAGLNESGKLIQMPTATDVGAVPTSRKINGKALTGNITLTVDDIGTSTIFLVSHPVGSLFE